MHLFFSLRNYFQLYPASWNAVLCPPRFYLSKKFECSKKLKSWNIRLPMARKRKWAFGGPRKENFLVFVSSRKGEENIFPCRQSQLAKKTNLRDIHSNETELTETSRVEAKLLIWCCWTFQTALGSNGPEHGLLGPLAQVVRRHHKLDTLETESERE